MLWWECKYLSIWWFLGASQCFLLVDFKSEIIICMRSMEKLQWSGNWKLQILVELLNFECDRKFWIVSTVGMCVCKAMCLCACVKNYVPMWNSALYEANIACFTFIAFNIISSQFSWISILLCFWFSKLQKFWSPSLIASPN